MARVGGHIRVLLPFYRREVLQTVQLLVVRRLGLLGLSPERRVVQILRLHRLLLLLHVVVGVEFNPVVQVCSIATCFFQRRTAIGDAARALTSFLVNSDLINVLVPLRILHVFYSTFKALNHHICLAELSLQVLHLL